MKRPKNLDKKYYGWCPKKNHCVFMLNIDKTCFRCKEEKERKSKGLCMAKLGHGPGHMSRTYCQVKGPHKVHMCVYGRYDQVARWKGPVCKQKFTGAFDEPPSVGEE